MSWQEGGERLAETVLVLALVIGEWAVVWNIHLNVCCMFYPLSRSLNAAGPLERPGGSAEDWAMAVLI